MPHLHTLVNGMKKREDPNPIPMEVVREDMVQVDMVKAALLQIGLVEQDVLHMRNGDEVRKQLQ